MKFGSEGTDKTTQKENNLVVVLGIKTRKGKGGVLI